MLDKELKNDLSNRIKNVSKEIDYLREGIENAAFSVTKESRQELDSLLRERKKLQTQLDDLVEGDKNIFEKIKIGIDGLVEKFSSMLEQFNIKDTLRKADIENAISQLRMNNKKLDDFKIDVEFHELKQEGDKFIANRNIHITNKSTGITKNYAAGIGEKDIWLKELETDLKNNLFGK